MGLIPTAILASQLVWNRKVEGPQPSRAIWTIFRVLDEGDAAATLTEQGAELGQVEQLLRELRPDEGVQRPSTRDLRENYRRYDVPS
jgi:hypothetical protein